MIESIIFILKQFTLFIVIASHNLEIWDMADEVVDIDKLG